MPRLLTLMALALLAATAVAQDYLRDKAEVEALLSGATLNGIYLRTQSAYTLEFRADGTLADKDGAAARWWVNDGGQYCREWLSGRLAGNQACMDIVREGNKVDIYSNGKKVAAGELSRP
jgi:hypothetical protein